MAFAHGIVASGARFFLTMSEEQLRAFPNRYEERDVESLAELGEPAAVDDAERLE